MIDMRLFGGVALPTPQPTRSVRKFEDRERAAYTEQAKRAHIANLEASPKVQARKAARAAREAALTAYVVGKPGVTFEELKARFKVHYSVLYKDLRGLIAADAIASSKYKDITRFGPPGYAYEAPAGEHERKPKVYVGAHLLEYMDDEVWYTTTELQVVGSRLGIRSAGVCAALRALQAKGRIERDQSERVSKWRKR